MSDSASVKELTPFHVALQVRDLSEARRFYSGVLGCPEGRSDAAWIDFNLFGHQFVVHHNPAIGPDGSVAQYVNPVDGHGVPVPHCGVVLKIDTSRPLCPRHRWGHGLPNFGESEVRMSSTA